MAGLSRTSQFYILGLTVTAGVILAWALARLSYDPIPLFTLGLFVAMIAVADLFPIITMRGDAEVTMSMALLLGCAILFGPAFSATATFLGTTAAELRQKRAWYKVVFNVSQLVLTVTIVAVVYKSLADPDTIFLNSDRDLGALVIAGFLYYFMNNTLVPLMVAFVERVHVFTVWRVAFRDLALHELAMIPLGAMLALLWQATPWAIILAILPVLVVRFSMGLVRDLREQTKVTLFALADAIDARDPYTFQHSQRVASYADLIAKEMNLPYDELDTLVTSARIHDLGKIGMPDRLLLKPGAFTPEERTEFRRHVGLGEKLLSRFPAFGLGREIVEDHHEWYDGSGYPRGKKGEEIPLGARILSVADAFDAMTSDRPYRKAMAREKAIAELQKFSGTQFDPRVVQAFIAALSQQEAPQPAAIIAEPQPQLAGPLSDPERR